MVSPLTIELMLQCYCSNNPAANIGERRWNSEAAREARAWLLAEGLVNADERPTDRGKAWVHFICATPLPRMKWTMPDRDEVNDLNDAYARGEDVER